MRYQVPQLREKTIDMTARTAKVGTQRDQKLSEGFGTDYKMFQAWKIVVRTSLAPGETTPA